MVYKEMWKGMTSCSGLVQCVPTAAGLSYELCETYPQRCGRQHWLLGPRSPIRIPVLKSHILDTEVTNSVENEFNEIEERIARRWSIQIPERVYDYKPLPLNRHEHYSVPFHQLTRHNSFPTSFHPSLPTQTRHQNTSSGSTAFLI
jgi:hypothetical protein